MLDRFISFALRKLEVGGRHVVLEVHEMLVALVAGSGRRREPDRLERRLARLRNVRGLHLRLPPLGPRRLRRRFPGRMALADGGAELERSIGGARGDHSVVMRLGPKGLQRLVEGEAAAIVAPQVDGRVEPARHRHEIAGDARLLGDAAAPRTVGSHLHALDAEIAGARLDARDHRASRDGDAGLARRVDERALGVRPDVDHRAHRDVRRLEDQRRAVGVVVVGEDHPALPRRDAVPFDVAAHRLRQHHARPVVVGEDDGPLDGARGEHDAPRPHFPQPLARQPRSREQGIVVGDPLGHQHVVVMEVRKHRGAGQHVHVFRRRQQAGFRRRPLLGRGAVDRASAQVGDAAEAGALVGDDDFGAVRRRRFCRRKAGCARSDDEDVAVDVNVLVGIGIAAACRPPEPRGAPDERLVESLPERLRPHEGLVVEAGGEEARQPSARRADVELEARPPVLADRDEPVMELDHGGAQVRLVPVSLADADQRVHLFRPKADDAARPVILEAAPHQAPAVGEQRRCEAVARMSGERPSVEAEGDAP